MRWRLLVNLRGEEFPVHPEGPRAISGALTIVNAASADHVDRIVEISGAYRLCDAMGPRVHPIAIRADAWDPSCRIMPYVCSTLCPTPPAPPSWPLAGRHGGRRRVALAAPTLSHQVNIGLALARRLSTSV